MLADLVERLQSFRLFTIELRKAVPFRQGDQSLLPESCVQSRAASGEKRYQWKKRRSRDEEADENRGITLMEDSSFEVPIFGPIFGIDKPSSGLRMSAPLNSCSVSAGLHSRRTTAPSEGHAVSHLKRDNLAGVGNRRQVVGAS